VDYKVAVGFPKYSGTKRNKLGIHKTAGNPFLKKNKKKKKRRLGICVKTSPQAASGWRRIALSKDLSHRKIDVSYST